MIVPFLLSLTAGYVDTAGFLALQGLFTAHVTGNFVTLGASLALGTSGAVAKLLALPVFCAVVMAVRLLSSALTPRWRFVFEAMLSLKVLLLIVGAVLAIEFGPFPNGDSWQAVITGMVLVSAMAIQNAAHRCLSRKFTSVDPDDWHDDADHDRSSGYGLREGHRASWPNQVAGRNDVQERHHLCHRVRRRGPFVRPLQRLVFLGAPAIGRTCAACSINGADGQRSAKKLTVPVYFKIRGTKRSGMQIDATAMPALSDFSESTNWSVGPPPWPRLLPKPCPECSSNAPMICRARTSCGRPASLKDFQSLVTLRGNYDNTGPNDFRPIKQVRLVQFDGSLWQPIGDVIDSAFLDRTNW
ncbi:hypothetical protein ACVWW1_000279 [Bradyrhizobium sp. JR3.5]